MESKERYPLGQQDFKTLRERGLVYVDKTRFVRKYDGSADEALRQIENKKYDRIYQMDGRQIIRIGATFSSETRCIEDWKIQM